jgi:tannase
MYPDSVFDYCNITYAYSHNVWDDRLLVTYWMPTSSNYEHRFLATGGGGYAINSCNLSLPGGVMYGAASGMTDGGFGGFDNQFDSVFPKANGTSNWEAVYMLGYQAVHEMTVLGKAFAKNFYNSTNATLYSYYQGCSEGGREGWSQVQRMVANLMERS